MFSDSHFEIEKRGNGWRVSAKGLPALGLSFAVVAIGAVAILWWMAGHP